MLLLSIGLLHLFHSAFALRGPTIVEHPPSESAYRVGESITLPCQADQESNATYLWKKDGRELDVSERRVSLVDPGRYGHLLIRNPVVEDEGLYQCFASNQKGTAVSIRSQLKRAFFLPFPSVTDVAVKRPEVGESLIIECSPPLSFPQDIPYWGFNSPGSKVLNTLINDERILVDYNGHLYFANVIESDARDDLEYVCVVSIKTLGAIMHGNNVKVQPILIAGSPQPRSPTLLWSSKKLDIAVKGQNKKMKCIFGGYPTPKVTWRRIDRQTNKMTYTNEGKGTEVVIQNVDETDSGEYECSAMNSASSSPVIQRIKLVVQTKPFWSQDQPPADTQVEEEDDAEFTCQAYGTPKPTISWGINGVGLEKLASDSRRYLEGNTLHFRNVTKDDSLVVQCVAENDHGSILANAHLHVISEPPSFTATPHDKKVVIGGNVTFQCRAYGAPRPVITWQRGDPPRPLVGLQYKVKKSGDLEITGVSLDDEDVYFCVATNKHEATRAAANLAVRKPTTIANAPAVVSANKSDDVILPCDVTTDEKERSKLKVEWRKNGLQVDYTKEPHLSMDRATFSLKIRSSMVKDTASYTCRANTELDSVESNPTQLVVRDRPESPTDLRVDTCTSYEAAVSFLPGNDNNDPVSNFTVFYSIDDEPMLTKGPVINMDQNSISSEDKRIVVKIPVLPWRSYTFNVAATNGIGTSELSSTTAQKCITPEMPPKTNPKNVCSKLRGSGQLVITWDAVPKEEHFGREYRYVVRYEPLHSSEEYKNVTVWVDYDQPPITEIVVHDLPVFTKYAITVWSENNAGPSPYSSRERKIGYSSEGKPLITPRNFRLNGNRYNGTYGEFIWDPVDTSSQNIQGFFRGYRIKFWRENHPNDIRTEDVILENKNLNLCPELVAVPQPSRRRRQIGSGPVFGSTNKLWPYSKIIAGVSVLNNGHDGDLSNTIVFETPAGPPEAVKDLIVTEFGSSHITIAWSLPSSSHGIIQSFILEYQVAPPEVGKTRREVLEDPLMLTRKITDLQSQTTYRITLYAVTVAGPGQAIFIDQLTLPDSNPDQPKIYRIEAGIDSANVSFVSTARPPKRNPGSKFYIEYTKEGQGKDWNKTYTDPQSPENWVQVKDLEPGVYFFRAVAVNGRDGHNLETRSDVMRVVIGEPREYAVEKPSHEGLIQHAGASTSWFIVLMCLIILLLIIMFIICYTRHSRGDVYPVSEKEKSLGRDPFATEDQPFGEYTNPGKPNQSGSRGSLDSEDKPMESDTDSLGEYEDQDTSKFNEDGSFIGLYGDKERPSRPQQASMNTFV